ncbi:DUF6648 family protein [Clostridium formicaceticum]|uniref:Uncharacterized protein n=1 Tax=Clostridium formicaceticum TaxID=1497 RepID=A0AAC9WHB2_9CLOT|nr:DUF6648 family protein [Clostridium formicaceticum]AOY78094.1 hypothetical protein BJL90_20850 [Clostridium formicaceticum]ARE88741.1 hypothetical protein CLFO_31470 [Clostridium formicaceticum]
MKYVEGENIFEKFFQQRQSLIQQFRKGDITKKEYIEEGYAYIKRMNIQPFKRVDNFNKAIYNYQYYNSMAKYCYLKAKEIKKYDKHPEMHKDYLDKVNYYYHKKDQSTLKAVELLDFYDVEAYYIKVTSTHLKENLFEVVFKDYEDIILHSRSQSLLNRLQEEGVFKEGIRTSLIENYINAKY